VTSGAPLKKGDAFEVAFQVTERLHAGFMDLFDDRNPMHVDDAYARDRGYRGKVMHGNILGGFLSCLVGEHLPIKQVVIQSQTMNFASPVYVDDRLVLNAAVADVFESVGAVELTFRFTNQDGAKVAFGTIQIGVLR
jgi:acyl dehydratase